MLSQLDKALKAPRDVVLDVFNASDASNYESRVCSAFSALFADQQSLGQITRLTRYATRSSLPGKGSLVRFRAMVQDTGLSTEVYPGTNSRGEPLAFGFGEDESHIGAEADACANEDFGDLRERQSLFIVSVPAETEWAQRQLDDLPEQDMLKDLKLEGREPAADAVSQRFPSLSEPHFGCAAKLYGDLMDQLKIGELHDFVGILGETTLSSAYDQLSNDEASESAPVIPAIHVLFTRPAASLKLADDDHGQTGHQLLDYLAGALGGDHEAADWLLMSLLAKVHTRPATGAALGSMSINLALPAGLKTDIREKLCAVLPTLLPLELSIETLNDAKTRLAPVCKDEQLQSGALQVPDSTNVLVDLCGLGEGELKEQGINNLRALSTAMTQHKLVYSFPYFPFELPVDLNFVVVSEGKAIIPSACVVYVQPGAGAAETQTASPSREQLDRFRTFIQRQKHASFTIPPEMSDIIQADYVERRQKSVGGEGMNQEDLVFRMTAARLYALSHGQTRMDKETWMQVSTLDEKRKDRIPRKAAK